MTVVRLLTATLPLLLLGAGWSTPGGMSINPPASDFCDTAGTNLFCEDFEENESDCTALVTNPADTVNTGPSSFPDCASIASPGPLNGSFSLLLDGDTQATTVESIWNDDFSVACDTTVCRLTFKFAVADSTVHDSSTQFMVGFLQGGTKVIDFRYSENLAVGDCRTTDSDCGANDIAMKSDGTVYHVCLEYDFGASPDTGILYVDDDAETCDTTASVAPQGTGEGNAWCSCDQTTTTRINTTALRFFAGSNRGDFLYDDIVVTQE